MGLEDAFGWTTIYGISLRGGQPLSHGDYPEAVLICFRALNYCNVNSKSKKNTHKNWPKNRKVHILFFSLLQLTH